MGCPKEPTKETLFTIKLDFVFDNLFQTSVNLTFCARVINGQPKQISQEADLGSSSAKI